LRRIEGILTDKLLVNNDFWRSDAPDFLDPVGRRFL
jgi:hypothetical protein